MTGGVSYRIVCIINVEYFSLKFHFYLVKLTYYTFCIYSGVWVLSFMVCSLFCAISFGILIEKILLVFFCN